MKSKKDFSNGVKPANIRVRFAPSPTGYLHVGGVRTALFNWLFARNKNGKFILRIEDTDRERSTKEALDDILNSLKWLRLDWDLELFFQSERISIYKEHAQKLLEKDLAYKSKGDQGEAIVFRSNKEKVVINDLVHGEIEFDASLIDDFVILKSDGMPTYNFACVVDDALMDITHVIRGDDHISNTPKQIMLYKMLGFKLPQFAHVPMILGPDGARLSKRHGATSVGEYSKQGILPHTLVNFLALLGWAPGNNQEILSIKELVDKFSLKRITGKSAVFNVDKLNWMNGVYISKLKDDELISLCSPFIEEAGFLKTEEDKNRLSKIIPLFKKRIKLLPEIVDSTEYFFKEKIKYAEDAKSKLGDKELLKKIKEKVEGITEFETKQIEDALKSLFNELSLSTKEFMQTIRAAITGRIASAGIFETMVAMGKELVLRHLDQAISLK